MANESYVLAFDLGTGGVKAALFNDDLIPYGRVFAEYPTRYPGPGKAEQDPQNWWDSMKLAFSRLKTQTKIQSNRIAVVSIDAMSPVLVPCDARGTAICPSLIWLDRRAVDQCRTIDREAGSDLYRINGNHNDPSNIAPKALWIRQNEPDLYKKTTYFHSAVGYMVHRLTGEPCMDVTQCGLTQLCNTGLSCWDDSLIHACGLDREKFPVIVESSSVVGTVTPAVSKETGLPAGAPVVAGAMDNVAAGLGLGVVQPDETYISAGTATNMCVCTNSARYVREFHLYRHVCPGRFLSVAGVDYGGAGVKWLKNILNIAEYREIDRLARESLNRITMPLVYLPYVVGQRAPLWNNACTGVLMGIHPSVDRRDIIRTFMEGNAIALANVADLFYRCGYRITEARLTGGVARSPVNTAIFSDVLGLPLKIFDDSDVSVRGAAMIGAYAAGMFDTFEEMAGKIKARKQIQPDAKRNKIYRKLLSIFNSVYQNLQNEFIELAKLREELS